MLRRYLEVLSTHARVLMVLAVVAPTVLAAGDLALDRSSLVTARLWIPPSSFPLATATAASGPTTPSQVEAGLMLGLMTTDGFVDRVLSSMDPRYAAGDPARKADQRRDLRTNLVVVPQGADFLAVSFNAQRSIDGVQLVTSVLSAFSETVPAIQLVRSASPSTVSDADLQAARAAVERTFGAVGRLGSAGGTAPALLLRSLNLQALLAEASTATGQYREQLAAGTVAGMAGTPQTLADASFQVIDPPAVAPSSMSRAAGLFGLGLLSVVGAALILAYVVALVDPRVKTGTDAQRRTGIPYLGDTGPQLESA